MTSREFCYWLQGFFEISGATYEDELTSAQIKTIRDHLNLVFVHEIDPSYTKDPKVQAFMQAVHDGKVSGPIATGPGFTPNRFNNDGEVKMRC
jgi:hypothetical protein